MSSQPIITHEDGATTISALAPLVNVVDEARDEDHTYQLCAALIAAKNWRENQ